MKKQVMVLEIEYEDEYDPPTSWDWPTILDLGSGEVKIIAFGPELIV